MLNLLRRFRFIIHKQRQQNQSEVRQLKSGWRRAFCRWRVVYVNVKSHASGGQEEQLSLKREKRAESHSGIAAALFKGPLIKWQALCCLHMEAPSSIQRLSVLPRIRQRLEPERERGKNSSNLQKSGTEWSASGIGRGWRRAFSLFPW